MPTPRTVRDPAVPSSRITRAQAQAAARAVRQRREGTPRCPCGCCHAVDHGPCPTFERGANGRCVFCDHGGPCHGAGAVANHNVPL